MTLPNQGPRCICMCIRIEIDKSKDTDNNRNRHVLNDKTQSKNTDDNELTVLEWSSSKKKIAMGLTLYDQRKRK